MNILFIATSHNPFNPTQGASQRTSLLLQACAAIANVDVISFCTENEPSRDAYNIVYQSIVNTHNPQNRFAKFRCLLTPWKPETVFGLEPVKKEVIDRYVQKKQYDYIVIRYMPDAIQCGLIQYASKLVIDVDDHPVDAIFNKSLFVRSLQNKIYHKIYAMAVKWAYNVVLHSVNYASFTNAAQVRTKNSFHLPNVPYYDLPTKQDITDKMINHRLLFVGDLAWPLNIHGIKRFMTNIYPRVLNRIPELTLHIVGNIRDEELINELQAYNGVSVMGFVPKLSEEYEKCVATVVPIYHGAGTCIKVLEAMQMQRVCVTTPIGFRGYNVVFTPNEDCLLANDDNEFVEKIIQALTNNDLRNKIVSSSYIKQKQFYSKDNFFSIVKEKFLKK